MSLIPTSLEFVQPMVGQFVQTLPAQLYLRQNIGRNYKVSNNTDKRAALFLVS